MKKLFTKAIAAFLAAAIVLPAGTAAAFAENTDKSAEPNYYLGSFYYRPGEGEIYGLSDSIDYYAYSDDYFTKSSKEYDSHLATLSMSLAEASVSSTREPFTPEGYMKKNRDVIAFLEDTGFSDIEINNDYTIKPTKDTIGVACAHKKIVQDGKEYTMLVIVPRSAGYEMEWGDNFVLGAEGDAKGFDRSSDNCLEFAKNYVAENGISGDIKVWTAGYSRGAAISNLTAKKLINDPKAYLGDSIELAPENLYAYTFGTPYAADTAQDPHNEKYAGIFNIYQNSELASMMAPVEMGFDRYGTSTMIRDMDKYDEMLANLKICNPGIYDEFIETTSSEHFMPKKLGFTDGSIGMVDDPDSYIPADASTYLSGLGAYLTQITGGREGYAENYEEAFSDFIGYVRSLNGDESAAFGAGLLNSDSALDAAVAMYAYFMKQKLKTEINATDEEIMAKAQEIALTIKNAAAEEESKDGSEEVGIDAGQIADLALKLGNYLFMDADDIRPIAAGYLCDAIYDGMTAAGASQYLVDKIANPEAAYSLTFTLSHLLFGNIWQSKAVRPLLINNEQMKSAATLIDNITKLMYDHTNEVYMSWLRLDDSIFADYKELTPDQINGYRRVYLDAENLEALDGTILNSKGQTVGVIEDGALVETTDKRVGFTTTDNGGFLRIPMDMNYSVVFKNFSGAIAASVNEYDVYTAVASEVFTDVAEDVENATVTLSLPKPDRDYTIPTDVQYTLSVHEDKGGDVLYGDANGDGTVNILDAAIVQRAANQKITLNEEQALAADVNGDGIVDVLDVSFIQKYIVGKINAFPVEKA